MKLKLLPSLKEKKRYMAFEMASEGKISKKDMLNSIQKGCKDFMGEYSYAKAGVELVENLIGENKGVIRVNNKYIDQVKGALMLIKEINKNRVVFKNTKVSGALNKLKRGG